MQPELSAQLFTPLTQRDRARAMEQVMIAVRRRWFGAVIAPDPGGPATVMREMGGEMITLVDGEPAQVDALIADAALRSAYIVATDYSQPADLRARLRRAGFRPVQQQSVHLLADAPRPDAPDRPAGGLLSWFRRRRPLPPEVVLIDRERLPEWNAVCWRAFGARGNEAMSLLEKEFAYYNMGGSARWYLATVGEEPAGTALLYQDVDAAQVLAVGTLPQYRGRGVATALMRRLISDWQATGSGFLFLDTTPDSPAERLYGRLGFRKAYAREIYAPRPCP